MGDYHTLGGGTMEIIPPEGHIIQPEGCIIPPEGCHRPEVEAARGRDNATRGLNNVARGRYNFQLSLQQGCDNLPLLHGRAYLVNGGRDNLGCKLRTPEGGGKMGISQRL